MKQHITISFEVTAEMLRDLKAGKLDFLVTAAPDTSTGFFVNVIHEVRDGQPLPDYMSNEDLN